MGKIKTEKSIWQFCTQAASSVHPHLLPDDITASVKWICMCDCQGNRLQLAASVTDALKKNIQCTIAVRNKQPVEAQQTQRSPHLHVHRLKEVCKEVTVTVKDMSHSWVSEWELPSGWTLHCEPLDNTKGTQLKTAYLNSTYWLFDRLSSTTAVQNITWKEWVYMYLTDVLQEVFSAEVKVIITGN